MASARSLTAASRLFSTSLRRHHHTGHPFNTRSDTPHPYGVFKNPFGVAEDGKGGPRRIAERIFVNERWVVMRIDMPGLNSESVKLKLNEEKNIEIEGEEPILKFGYVGGYYKLVFPGDSRIYEMEQWKAELKHGVLWLTLPLTPIAQRAMVAYSRIYNKPFPF